MTSFRRAHADSFPLSYVVHKLEGLTPDELRETLQQALVSLHLSEHVHVLVFTDQHSSITIEYKSPYGQEVLDELRLRNDLQASSSGGCVIR